MRRTLLATVTAATLLAGCSTDLDINAPYKETTVVYALFNQREDTHFVKINKAFLGEGDALAFAQIRDSSEYTAEDIEYAKVVEITNGNDGATFDLQPITLNNREPGTFYGPAQTLYYFTNPLNESKKYDVRLKIKGKEIQSSSVIVNNFTIRPPAVNVGYELDLFNVTNELYKGFELKWNVGTNCKRFQVYWRFNYDEVTGTDTIPNSFTQELGTLIAAPSQNELSLILEGETFYRTIRDRIKNNNQVSSRIFRGLDFLFVVADEEFNTYLSLQEPVSGIVEERPTYSNVNGGLGLVASRYTKSLEGKWLASTSLEHLRNGPFTQALNFCTPEEPADAPTCD
jgi:hypothetical protein